MQNTTSLELRCNCAIPFQADLIPYLKKIVSRERTPGHDPVQSHSDEIALALSGKTLFLKVELAESSNKVRPSALRRIQKFFHKDMVGVMEVGREVTYVFL